MNNRISLSFELFPPHDDNQDDRFLNDVATLQAYGPSFQSLTYGAGGSKRDRSERLVGKILARGHHNIAAHLGCAGQSRERVQDLVKTWWGQGLRHIVAIRGDAADQGLQADNYQCSAELVEGIREVAPFEVSVAAYPEKHPKSISIDAELDHLKRKLDNGATRALTQFFFDPDHFLRYRDRCAADGITQPVVPGILLVRGAAQVQRFAGLCGASVPQWLINRFDGLDRCPEAVAPVTVATAVEQINALHREGVEEFHLYTLNRVPEVVAICHSLGITPNWKEAA